MFELILKDNEGIIFKTRKNNIVLTILTMQHYIISKYQFDKQRIKL